MRRFKTSFKKFSGLAASELQSEARTLWAAQTKPRNAVLEERQPLHCQLASSCLSCLFASRHTHHMLRL